MRLLILLSIFFGFSARAEICGQLAGVKGKGVEILRLQKGREGDKIRHGLRIEEGKTMPLECDDVIVAARDSSAKIILANGKLSLGPESRIELAAHSVSASRSEPARVSLINLTYGKMRALIKKAPAAPGTVPATGAAATVKRGGDDQARFRVRTFSAVAGVRGTDFYTSYEPNSGLTEQATIEGAVEVQQVGSKQKVVVEAGSQVAVETTPAAVLAAEKGTIEPPRDLPQKDEVIKAIQVTPIRDSLRNEIRVVSAVVKDDKDFAHGQAVQMLGKPETWTMERERVPDRLDQIKNEF